MKAMKKIALILGGLLFAVSISTQAFGAAVTINVTGIQNHSGVTIPVGAYVQVIQSADSSIGAPGTNGLPAGDSVPTTDTIGPAAGQVSGAASIPSSNYVTLRIWETWNGVGSPPIGSWYGTIPAESVGSGFVYTFDPAGSTIVWAQIAAPPTGTLQFSSATYSVGEAGPTVTITVTRTGGSAGAATVHYATSNGTATAGSDYTATSGDLSWAAGDAASKTITIPIIDDAVVDPAETFTCALSGATGASLGAPASTTVTINDNDVALNITTLSLPGGTVGTAYNQAVMAVGGTPPYTWSISAGSLPAGLSLNAAAGIISGTPTAVENPNFTIQVSGGGTDTQALSINIVAAGVAPNITTLSLPGAVVGTAYSQTLNVSGGTAPYTWSVTAGSLPAGLSLNAASGVISGTPTTVQNSTFTIQVSGGGTDTQDLSINVTSGGGGPTISGVTGLPTNGGYIGETIVINGSGFGASKESSTVTVGGVITNPTAWSATQITCAIPSGVTAGSVPVVVTTSGGASAPSNITVQSGGVVIDDVEGGSVGSFQPGLVNSGYYTYGAGITPNNDNISSSGPQAAARHDGGKGMRVTYSFTSGWGGGWGATLANTLDASAYDRVNFFINWDGSANNFKLGLTDAAGHVYVASVSNVTLNSLGGYAQITIPKSSFAEDTTNASRVPGALDWATIKSYGFTYTSNSTSAAPQSIDSITAGVVDLGGGGTNEVVTGEVIITNIQPAAGPAGTKFTAMGSGFGASQGQSILIFENNTTGINYQVDVTSWNVATIEATVPRLAPVGAYTLKVVKMAISQGTMRVMESNPRGFTVTAAVSAAGVATVYPNPFNPLSTNAAHNRANISFSPTSATNIGLYIFDSTARQIYKTVVPNTTQVTWDGKDLNGSHVADGLYLIRIVNEDSKTVIARGKVLVTKR